MRQANDLIKMIRGDDPNPGDVQQFKIGTIPSSYSGSGRPTVQLDSESAASSRKYPYLSSYTPTAGDRVLLGAVGHTYVILGKIV